MNDRPRGRGRREEREREREPKEFEDRVIKINRCAKVVKGGRRFSFSALVVVGNRKGLVGVGFGKANEVPSAVEKAVKDARKNLVAVSLRGNTIPHETKGRFGAAAVVLLPASPGTGIIASAAVRAVAELAGVKDILTKSLGSNNPVNLVKAARHGFLSLKNVDEVESLRGVEIGRRAGS
ncbi:MAG: 30S ribosomal protein S5 [Planctomycetes bacterium]|nr:30S ribosomal protein S5 [Planctomycetota bacterium]